MMASLLLLWLSWVVPLLFSCLLFNAHVFANSFNTSSVQFSCHGNERSALLQFKQSFVINRSASVDEGAYPKVLSWKPEGESSNCCSWDGVECDEKTGHVIGLILNSSCLYGSINSNSSLFRLVHLKKLNLADNHFNYSLIPSAIGQFTGLAYLNLSYSSFYGQIPFEISHLSKLTFLDLSTEFDPNDPSKQYRLLELKNPNLRSLIQKLTALEVLHLTSVHIPSTVPGFFVNFTSLKRLVLLNCGLYGKFPAKIFHLPNLQVLRLGTNKNLTGYLPEFHQRSPLEWLTLSKTGFSGIMPSSIEKLESLQKLLLAGCNFSRPLPSSLGKLTQLIRLDLGEIYSSGPIPTWIGNLTGLTGLWLHDNNLSGDIPSWLGNLTQLEILSLGGNTLNGYIPPSLRKLTKLSFLSLPQNSITGPIPTWIGNLTQLIKLDLAENHLSGPIPTSIGNLTALTGLWLDDNNLSGDIPPWLGNLTQLEILNLGGNTLGGYIPSSFQNLSQLSFLSLHDNSITGPIPTWIGNLTQLTQLFLHRNEFYGSIPNSLSTLMNLRYLLLYDNNLSGMLEFDMFFNMGSLVHLELGGNNISLLFKQRSVNSTARQFIGLGLGSCSLTQFPYFLQYQNKLEYLLLSGNQIHGQIPKWMWNNSVETLSYLILRDNLLVNFHPPSSTSLPWINLLELDLSYNMLQGHLPIPRKSITYYQVSNNLLTGEIPLAICNCSSVSKLDFSSNNFSGNVPECLGKSTFLSVLNLRNNSFHGAIPQLCERETNLRMMDLSRNKFEGQLPRFFAACMMLEYLDVSKNQLAGDFPAFLGTLPELKLLNLRHNGFSGVIKKPKQGFQFPKLRIIDISINNFTGDLPSEYIFIWNCMRVVDITNSRYMNVYNESLSVQMRNITFTHKYFYSTTIVDKGVERYYATILENFAYIDFSCNKFTGEIPQVIGNLKALHSLNLSFNSLTGGIPSCLGNLTELESLDLSNNKLSGEIPQQLTTLTFLQSFNVSHNNLTGPIPQGKQFSTFENASFDSNPGLCGIPLSTKCENSDALPLQPSVVEEDGEDSESPIELDWKFVLAGCVSGFLVGVALGDMLIPNRQGWFVQAFRRIPPRMEIMQRRN